MLNTSMQERIHDCLRWRLRGFDISKRSWFEPLALYDSVGKSINSTVCFEIINGYLAKETMFRLHCISYTSYHHFIRFPLIKPTLEYIERPPTSKLFRRQHCEGVMIDGPS